MVRSPFCDSNRSLFDTQELFVITRKGSRYFDFCSFFETFLIYIFVSWSRMGWNHPQTSQAVWFYFCLGPPFFLVRFFSESLCPLNFQRNSADWAQDFTSLFYCLTSKRKIWNMCSRFVFFLIIKSQVFRTKNIPPGILRLLCVQNISKISWRVFENNHWDYTYSCGVLTWSIIYN